MPDTMQVKVVPTKSVILALVIVVILSIFVYAVWMKGWIPFRKEGIAPSPLAPSPVERLPSPEAEVSPPASLGGQIFEKAQNPIQGEVPQTNPFQETKTNPFEGIYKNPFE